jgi:TatD DNase family protein
MILDLIDIGANLTHRSFDSDRERVLERAREAGVTRLIVTGSSVDASRGAAALAAEHPGVLFATAGIHPHHASDCTPAALEVLEELARRDGVVAGGETGLDYFRDFSPRADQAAAFRAQLELAARLSLRLFLHERDAHADFVSILKPYLERVPGGVVHCFTGDREALRAYLDLGLYIGVTGWICDERRGTHLRELVAEIPADRLLIETDAPYLLPRDLDPKPRSRRNEPMYLPHVLEAVARCRGEGVEDAAFATRRATEQLFGLPVLRGESPSD